MESVEKTEISWPLTCRICLKNSDGDMKYIFGELCFSDDIVTKIIKCGGIPVDIMDGMPDRICDQCLVDLDVAYRFRIACQESYYQLNRLMANQEVAQKQCDDYSLEELKHEADAAEPEGNDNILIDSPKQNARSESLETVYLSEEALLDEEHSQEPLSKIERTECETLDSGKDISEPKVSKPEPNVKKGMKRLRKGRSVDPTTTYICYCCGNLYKSQSKLSQHIKLHSAEKPHECEICQKKFAQAAQLSRHMNSHTGNRPYQCKFCPSSFADPSTCIKHQRIHTNDRPFKCLECGKAFSYSNVLKVHQKIHTGEKPFSCSVCDKKFTQLHHKKSHERTHSNYVGPGGRTKKTENYSVEI